MRISTGLTVWAIAAMVAVPAGAQFTAVVAPPKARVDSVAVAATLAQQRDSTTRVTMTGMREWVDSAAATLGVRVDSVRVDTSARIVPVAPPAIEPAPPRTEAFREGAPAPSTATPLPLLAATGAVLLVCGLWLLRRRTCAGSSARS